ncbi:hypothetical protein KCP73_00610 [Salmonella enterica subsp. enterica]|nr:hypothetical protein KCP73_00610 [Salmonella enterica subsp. enterica]
MVIRFYQAGAHGCQDLVSTRFYQHPVFGTSGTRYDPGISSTHHRRFPRRQAASAPLLLDDNHGADLITRGIRAFTVRSVQRHGPFSPAFQR